MACRAQPGVAYDRLRLFSSDPPPQRGRDMLLLKLHVEGPRYLSFTTRLCVARFSSRTPTPHSASLLAFT